MRTAKQAHIVPNAVVTEQVEGYAKIRRAKGHLDQTPDAQAYMRRSRDGPFGHSRESMTVMEQMAPVAYHHFGDTYFQVGKTVDTGLVNVKYLLHPKAVLTPQRRGALLAYVRLYWSIASDVVLLAADGHNPWDEIQARALTVGTGGAYHRGTVLHVARAVWTMARVGQAAIPELIRMQDAADTAAEVQLATLALLTMSLR